MKKLREIIKFLDVSERPKVQKYPPSFPFGSKDNNISEHIANILT